MKLSETELCENASCGRPFVLYMNEAVISIIDPRPHGICSYTRKLIIKLKTENLRNLSVNVRFNPESASKSLFKALMSSGIDPYSDPYQQGYYTWLEYIYMENVSSQSKHTGIKEYIEKSVGFKFIKGMTKIELVQGLWSYNEKWGCVQPQKTTLP